MRSTTGTRRRRDGTRRHRARRRLRRPRPPSPVDRRQRAPAASAQHRRQRSGQEPVTIVVGALRPGVTAGGGRRLRRCRSASSRRRTPGSTSCPRSTTGRRRRSPRRSPAARCPTCSRSRSPTARPDRAGASSSTSTSASASCGYADKFNPNVLANGQDADGAIYAVPTQAYGIRCSYNRDPVRAGRSRPGQAARRPGTRSAAAAKTIAEQTGAAGFAQMATEQHRRLAARPRRDLRRAAAGWRRSPRTAPSPRPSTTPGPRPPSSASRPCAGRTTRWARTSTTTGARSTRRSRPARSACSRGSDLYT